MKIAAGFYFKGKVKSQIAVELSKLGNMEQVNEKKKFWKERLGKLKAMLEKKAHTKPERGAKPRKDLVPSQRRSLSIA